MHGAPTAEEGRTARATEVAVMAVEAPTASEAQRGKAHREAEEAERKAMWAEEAG